MNYCPTCEQSFHWEDHIQMIHGKAHYVRYQDEVWACSGCGTDLTVRFPDNTICPRCRRQVIAQGTRWGPVESDHETETLEGLEKRWRKFGHSEFKYRGRGHESTAIEAASRQQALDCADELAPILAGLRELRPTLAHHPDISKVPGVVEKYGGDAAIALQNMWKDCPCLPDCTACKWDALLGQPATAGLPA